MAYGISLTARTNQTNQTNQIDQPDHFPLFDE